MYRLLLDCCTETALCPCLSTLWCCHTGLYCPDIFTGTYMTCSMQAFKKILLVSSGTHLLALDQHAADERVRLEALQLQLCDALNLVSTPSQSILLPAAPARQQKISSRQGKVLSSHSFRSPVGVHLSSAQAVTLWDPKVAVCHFQLTWSSDCAVSLFFRSL